jgi:hypothetical protein
MPGLDSQTCFGLARRIRLVVTCMASERSFRKTFKDRESQANIVGLRSAGPAEREITPQRT